jgi:hypothetical protein
MGKQAGSGRRAIQQLGRIGDPEIGKSNGHLCAGQSAL